MKMQLFGSRNASFSKIWLVVWLSAVITLGCAVEKIEAVVDDGKKQYLTGSLEGEITNKKGSVHYDLPLSLPGGIRGMRPTLGIAYRQGGGNGPLGLGFQLTGLSSIFRCPATEKIDGFHGGIAFDDKDRFCLDGKRLVAAPSEESGADYYKVWDDPGYKVVAYGSKGAGYGSWVVYTKRGDILEYGSRGTSKEIYDGNSTRWFLTSRKDRFGNEIAYHYRESGNNLLIDSVLYSDIKISFVYQPRTDRKSAYKFGKLLSLTERLAKVRIYRLDSLLGEYRLEYNTIDSDKSWQRYSRIEKVSYCDGQGKCMAPLLFHFHEETSDDLPDELLQTTLASLDSFKGYVVGDLNKDGLNDLCYYTSGLFCILNRGEGNFSAPRKWTTHLDGAAWNKAETVATLSLLDINHDSWPDYCIVGESGLFCGLNDKGERFADDRYWSTALNLEHAIRFVDINQDNRPDFCAFKATVSTAPSTTAKQWERPSN